MDPNQLLPEMQADAKKKAKKESSSDSSGDSSGRGFSAPIQALEVIAQSLRVLHYV